MAPPPDETADHGGAAEKEHNILVWAADELLEAYEKLKSKYDADFVALSQFVQSGTHIARQISLLGVLGRAYIKIDKKGRKYIIFKGAAGKRPNLQGTRYARENPRVSAFVVGTKEIIEDATKATKIAIIAYVAIDVVQELLADRFSLASLGVRILSDVLQAVAAAAAGAAIGVIVTTIGVPTVIAFALAVAVGFGVGVLLTDLDNRYQLTEIARARMMGYEQQLSEKLSAARQTIKQVGQAIQQGQQAIREAVALYYEVNRLWATIEEYLRTGLPPVIR